MHQKPPQHVGWLVNNIWTANCPFSAAIAGQGSYAEPLTPEQQHQAFLSRCGALQVVHTCNSQLGHVRSAKRFDSAGISHLTLSV